MINADGLGVKVVYRNRDLSPTTPKIYTLRGYTELLRADLMRLVTDVEDLCYEANGNKDKEEWSDATFDSFNKIKHKLLDKAGDIGRLPDNLAELPDTSITQFVAHLVNEGG